MIRLLTRPENLKTEFVWIDPEQHKSMKEQRGFICTCNYPFWLSPFANEVGYVLEDETLYRFRVDNFIQANTSNYVVTSNMYRFKQAKEKAKSKKTQKQKYRSIIKKNYQQEIKND